VCAAFQLKLFKQAITNSEPAWTAFYWAEMQSQAAARKFALTKRLLLAHPVPSHHQLESNWRKTLLNAQQLGLREADPVIFEDVLRQHLFLNRHITSPNGSTLSSPAMSSAASRFTSRVIDLPDASVNGVHAITVNRIRAAIPPAWCQLVADGPAEPALGEHFVEEYDAPPNQLFEISAVNDHDFSCTVFDVTQNGVIQRPSHQPARVIAKQRFPLIRAHVIHQRSNEITLGALAITPIVSGQITINQLIEKKIKRVPIAELSINSTTKALTHMKQQLPNFDAKWLGIIDIHPSWKRVIKWTWCCNRNRKLNDFLLKLLHRRLPVGETRGYADDPGCLCGDDLETHQHLLVECPIVKPYWKWIQRAWRLTTDHNIATNTPTLIFSSVPPSRISKHSRAKWRLFEIVHPEALYSIWLQRCRAIFDDAPFSAGSIAVTLRGRIRLALEAARHLQRIDGYQALATAIINHLDAPI
jgi:hypothetical protein